MKRTALARSSTPMKRSGRLRPRSAKTIAAYDVRRPMVAAIASSRSTCDGYPLLSAAADASGADLRYAKQLRACRRREPCQPHEPLKRSRGGSIVDPDAVMWLCGPCHAFTEAEVILATAIGMLTPSWERNG